MEHGPKLLAESGRLEGEGGEELSLKLETSIQCTASDPHSLDEIAQNPLLGEHTPPLKGGKRKEGGGGPPLKGGEGKERGRKGAESAVHLSWGRRRGVGSVYQGWRKLEGLRHVKSKC